jgi:hypothetical protein
MIVVEASHVHVLKFLPLYTNMAWTVNIVNYVNGVYSLIYIILIIFIWSGNLKFYIGFSRELGLQ